MSIAHLTSPLNESHQHLYIDQISLELGATAGYVLTCTNTNGIGLAEWRQVGATGSTGGIGDVSGPASATDNAIARFDGPTGKLIQNSTGILDDSGNLLLNSLTLGVANSPTGYSPSANGIYQSPITIVTTVQGPWTAQAVTIKLTKSGSLVTLQIPAISVATTASSIIGFNANLPTWLIPDIGISIAIIVINNSASEAGYLGIGTDGSLTISRLTGTFDNSGSAGYRGVSASYRTS